MLMCKGFRGSSCGDFLKEENSHSAWLFHTGWSESVRCSMEKCHINVLLRRAEMWRLTPGYWFIHGLTGEAMDLALAATIKPFEMSGNQRSREMVSAHASGRIDDTLWCVARPQHNDGSTGHDAQTAVLLCVVPPDSPPPPYGKTWQQPLDSDPRVSLRNRRTNYSSVGHCSSSPAPLDNKDGALSATDELRSDINHAGICTASRRHGRVFRFDLGDESGSPNHMRVW